MDGVRKTITIIWASFSLWGFCSRNPDLLAAFVALLPAAFSCYFVGPVTADSAPISAAICREVTHRPESPHSIDLSTNYPDLSNYLLYFTVPSQEIISIPSFNQITP